MTTLRAFEIVGLCILGVRVYIHTCMSTTSMVGSVGLIQEAMVELDRVSCPVLPPPLLCARMGIRGFLVFRHRHRMVGAPAG